MHQVLSAPSRPGSIARRRRASVISAVLVALLLVATPAYALTVDRYVERVHLAAGAWLVESETVSSDLTIRVFNQVSHDTTDGTLKYKDPQVILFYTHKEKDLATNLVTRTEYEGFQALDGSSFTFDLKLNRTTAVLKVPMYGYRCIDDDGGAQGAPQGIEVGECEEISPITVDVLVTWEGYGPVDKSTSHESIMDIPGYSFQSHTTQISRNATLFGSVSGAGVELANGTADVGLLLIGTYEERTITD